VNWGGGASNLTEVKSKGDLRWENLELGLYDSSEVRNKSGAEEKIVTKQRTAKSGNPGPEEKKC